MFQESSEAEFKADESIEVSIPSVKNMNRKTLLNFEEVYEKRKHRPESKLILETGKGNHDQGFHISLIMDSRCRI